MLQAEAMWHKNDRQYQFQQEPPERRFRSNLAELFLDNQVSADRTMSLFQDARAAGTKHVEDLAKKSSYSRVSKKFAHSVFPNARRDLLRRLVKRSLWPPLYFAKIRVFDSASQQEVLCTFAMLLPHELAWAWATHADKSRLLDEGGMSTSCRSHLLKMKDQFHCSEGLALGLWIDGVPCNWDRSQSLECLSLNFPGLSGDNSKLRIPLAVINKRFLIKEKTMEDILCVLAWSFQWLAQGRFPVSRHDGSPFESTDAFRKQRSGQRTGIAGFLCELRGDWLMLKEVMKIPAWNQTAGCCFRCNVTPNGIRAFGSNAEWRMPHNRITHWQFLQQLLSRGQHISALYSCPGFSTDCIALDWLHAVDLGVCADFLGNFFWMMLPLQDGRTVEQRLRSLFLKIQQYYKEEGVQDRLDSLTETMLRKKPASSPKLRAKAAEARALVNFAVKLSASVDDSNPVMATARQAACELQACYQCLSKDNYSSQALMRHSILFCSLYGALEQHSLEQGLSTWKVKPKFHVFQELCLVKGNPSTHWVYRDEDFGGYLAAVSRRRGGANSVRATGDSELKRFRANHNIMLN